MNVFCNIIDGSRVAMVQNGNNDVGRGQRKFSVFIKAPKIKCIQHPLNISQCDYSSNESLLAGIVM